MTPHLTFDLLASACSLAMTLYFYQRFLRPTGGSPLESMPFAYPLALIGGAVIGGFGLGTLNLHLSGLPGFGRSILGALIGAIICIEAFKAVTGRTGSTGAIFIPAFCTSVAIGRIGCFLSGLTDATHGIPTALPWGHDYGDGIARHPVQLYESAAMAGFLAFTVWLASRHPQLFRAKGFYLMAGFYGLQRFAWEFLKPYGTVVGPFNIFHLACLALIAYAALMLRRPARVRP